MGPLQATKKVISSWSDFNSRSSRSEYWWGVLFVMLVTLAVQLLGFRTVLSLFGRDAVRSGNMTSENQVIIWILLTSIFIICFFVLPLTARRFKDHGWRGGWFRIASYLNFALGFFILIGWCFTVFGRSENAMSLGIFAFFLSFPPYASVIWCFWIGFVKPDPNTNQYGPNPNEVPQ